MPYAKEYYKNNIDYFVEKNKKYYELNKIAVDEKNKRWVANNREKLAAYHRERRKNKMKEAPQKDCDEGRRQVKWICFRKGKVTPFNINENGGTLIF